METSRENLVQGVVLAIRESNWSIAQPRPIIITGVEEDVRRSVAENLLVAGHPGNRLVVAPSDILGIKNLTELQYNGYIIQHMGIAGISFQDPSFLNFLAHLKTLEAQYKNARTSVHLHLFPIDLAQQNFTSEQNRPFNISGMTNSGMVVTINPNDFQAENFHKDASLGISVQTVPIFPYDRTTTEQKPPRYFIIKNDGKIEDVTTEMLY
ncbi:hypothetical protein A2335_02495 [Candidatus Peregrinibacteria bacterium RIFOXYB2_FULL_32_7]|nr:MAG: hypothetical protein A2335_02495 [Candidatus Peregrinibacteria bacterium RIFOXYB2_FULL_32_7]